MSNRDGSIAPSEQPDDDLSVDMASALAVLQSLFRRFCDDRKVDVPARRTCPPHEFFAWAAEALADDEVRDRLDLDTRTEAYEPVWGFLVAVAREGTLALRFLRAWGPIALCEQPKGGSTLASVNVVAHYTFADGSIARQQVYVTREMIDPPQFTDELVIELLHGNLTNFPELVTKLGLDEMNRQAATAPLRLPGKEDPYDVLIGGILDLVIPNVEPVYRDAIEHYLRLFQFAVRPPLNPSIITAYTQKIQDLAGNPAASAEPVGGWDEG